MAKPEAEVVNLPPAPALKPTETAARTAGVAALLDAMAADTAGAAKLAHTTIEDFEKTALEGIAQAKAVLETVRQCNETMQEYTHTGTQAIKEQRSNLARLVNARVRE